jgi:hypothetical protein
MSASQRFTATIAALASIPQNNLVAGTIFEFTGAKPRRISIWGVQDGAAVATPVVMSVTSGTNVQVEANTPVQSFTVAQGPFRDQHGIVTFVSSPGDRLVIPLRNTDPANPSNVRFLIEYTE